NPGTEPGLVRESELGVTSPDCGNWGGCVMKKLLVVFLLIVSGGVWSCGGDSGGGGSNPAFTGPAANLRPTHSADFKDRLGKFDIARCYAKRGFKHDAENRTSQNLHAPFIKIFYSPQLFKWMTKDNRQGPIPDGAMIFKEEYATQDSKDILFW